MLPWVPALVVIAAQIVATIAFYAAVRWTGMVRAIAFGLAFAGVIFAPLAIAPERREVRLGIALVAAWMSSKLYDLYFGVRPAERPTFGGYVLYVFNPFWMVYRLPRPNTRRVGDVRRLLLRIVLALSAYAACFAVFRVHWSAWPFALEHAAKALTIMPLMIFTTNAVAAAWRVAGGRGLDFMGRFPLFAATPGEFWRRWNQPAQQFFLTYGAAPLGGMRRPIHATLATFAISAAGHEYIFSLAAGRLQGYQTAFFLLHGLAVVATLSGAANGLAARSVHPRNAYVPHRDDGIVRPEPERDRADLRCAIMRRRAQRAGVATSVRGIPSASRTAARCAASVGRDRFQSYAHCAPPARTV